MTPLSQLTELDTDQQLTVKDENYNTYTGIFYWDSEEESHKIDDYKLVADYESETLYLVKPIDDDTISGFLTEIIEISTEESN